jgi:hypothetical protein
VFIPKLRRLPVTQQDLQGLDLYMPDDLVRYAFIHQFTHKEYRLLKLGLIEDEIAYVEDGWLYYFARHQPYKFDYKLLLNENEEGALVTELWADARLSETYIFGGTIAENLSRAVFDIQIREHPVHLDMYRRRKPELMKAFNTYPLDVEFSKHEFWKLIWGFIRRSMDDHWMSWFDFDTQTLHIHWYWKPHHVYQVNFEETNRGYKAIEVKISVDFDDKPFSPQHAANILHTLVSLNHYRYEVI